MTLNPRKFNGSQTPSLNDEIAAAQSEADIQDLLMQGRAYQSVSNRTMNRWQRTAKRRRQELKDK